MSETIVKTQKYPFVDVMKFIMSLFVVGIHTEPFGFNIWLDRGFGIVTRLCVPFFFIVGAYFFFLKERPLNKYIIRIGLLYLIWSLIYLPFDLKELSRMTVTGILKRYLWTGNEHALWYLCGTVIGTLIVFALQKIFSGKTVLAVTAAVYAVGCLISTWSPVLNMFCNIDFIKIENFIGVRNGLFYAPVYIALGMCLARNEFKSRSRKFYIAGFIGSMIMLAAESVVFVAVLHTPSTVLWISVIPAEYFMFRIILGVNWQTQSSVPVFLRKMSTMIFVSHYLFIILLSSYFSFAVLYICVSVSSILLSALIVKLSEKVKILRCLY